MDTDRLRYFCVIAQTGSLRKASDILRISPPALSKSMNVLEQELGRQLFTREGRGILLTDEGKRLVTQAEKVLQEIDALAGEITAGSQADENIRIGSFEVFSTYFIGPLMRETFPESALELHDLFPGELETALVNGRVDIGITYIPIVRPELDFLKVASIKMGVFGLRGAFSSLDVRLLPFAVPVQPINSTPTKVQGLDGWPEHRIPRYQKYKVTLMGSAMELCRQGIAVAYLPTFIVQLHNERISESFRLHEIPTERGVMTHQDVFLIKRKSDIEGTTHRKIAKALRLQCKA